MFIDAVYRENIASWRGKIKIQNDAIHVTADVDKGKLTLVPATEYIVCTAGTVPIGALNLGHMATIKAVQPPPVPPAVPAKPAAAGHRDAADKLEKDIKLHAYLQPTIPRSFDSGKADGRDNQNSKMKLEFVNPFWSITFVSKPAEANMKFEVVRKTTPGSAAHCGEYAPPVLTNTKALRTDDVLTVYKPELTKWPLPESLSKKPAKRARIA